MIGNRGALKLAPFGSDPQKAEFSAGCRAHGLPYPDDLKEKQVSAFHKSDKLLAAGFLNCLGNRVQFF